MTFRKTGRMLQPAELNRKTGAELGRVHVNLIHMCASMMNQELRVRWGPMEERWTPGLKILQNCEKKKSAAQVKP